MINKDKIAVTYSWNRMSYIINKSLTTKGLKVYTGDMSYINMNKFSLLKNECFRYPNFYKSPYSFFEYLIAFLNTNSIPYLIPTHEETFIISKYQSQLKDIKTLVPSFDALKIAHKKNLSTALASKLDIPIPFTAIPSCEADCLAFFNAHEKHVILKYENSNSSNGVFTISNAQQFEAHYKNIGGFILQEYVTGEGYGVSMLYNMGEIRASFTHKRIEEKLSKGGSSTVRIGTRNEILEEWSKKILDHLAWNGVAMVEYKYDEEKKKGWFIEINPRFWGSLALPYYSGMDFPYMYYQILRDGDVRPNFNYKEGINVKWLLGGALGFIDRLINDHKLSFNQLSLNADYFDDFSLSDPFILVGEMGYYLNKFLHSLELNPTKNASLNIDEI